MEIEIVKMADRHGEFILRGSSPSMANALRRTMLSDIPKMAIDKVEFHLGPIMRDDKEYESITPLFDEIVAHRLGMVPVPTDYTLFGYQKDCSCGGEGCPSCTIMYSINKTGPCTVLSGDMSPLGNAELKVKDEFIPVVELTGGQAVLIYATAVMGTARQHVKWQAAFGVGYKYLPLINIDPSKAATDDAKKAIRACPRGGFKVVDDKLVMADPTKCEYCKSCEYATQKIVTVMADDTSFFFRYDTDGSLTARQVLDKAIEVLGASAMEMSQQIASL